MSTALKVIRKLTPGLEANITGNKPFIYAPLCATAQVLRADVPGEEPDVTTATSFAENTRLLGKAFDRSESAITEEETFNSPEFIQIRVFARIGTLIFTSTFSFRRRLVFTQDRCSSKFTRHLPEFEPPQIMAKIIRERGSTTGVGEKKVSL